MIDVIMPCYNAEKYIEETIRSVMNQTEPAFRLICVDDCSTDNTHLKLQQLSRQDERILVLRNERNCGIAFTRNRGIKEGNAKYVAFLDDDDIMPVDRLKIGKKYLDENPNVGVVAGNYLIFDEKGNRRTVQKNRFYSATEVRSVLPFINIIPNGTTLVRREIIKKNNIIFQEMYGIEDYCFYAEISCVSDINILPDILLEHRVMETQYSAVCTNSNDRFEKRQEAFDQVHQRLIQNITDQCMSKDVNIYLRFMRENIKGVKLREVLQLYASLIKMKRAVKRKGNADYHVFCQSSGAALKRAVKAYVTCKIQTNRG